ncbi:hypothetical protein REPUB_Repub12eG0026100 [Reevesia pubescens]
MVVEGVQEVVRKHDVVVVVVDLVDSGDVVVEVQHSIQDVVAEVAHHTSVVVVVKKDLVVAVVASVAMLKKGLAVVGKLGPIGARNPSDSNPLLENQTDSSSPASSTEIRSEDIENVSVPCCCICLECDGDEAILRFIDILFNGEMIMLIIGLCRIMVKDPSFVAQESFCLDVLDESSVLGVQETYNESSVLQKRVRYCKNCRAYVQGCDHHCPAFWNCFGLKNYFLFMLILVGFIITETFYIVCSSQCKYKLVLQLFDDLKLYSDL